MPATGASLDISMQGDSFGRRPFLLGNWKMKSIQNFNDFVMMTGDKPMTDSRKVAAHFQKQHAKVTRAISTLRAATGEWGVANFGETSSIDAQNGQAYYGYQMTKDGFMLLVMGFTGKRALAIKLDFIAAFNGMSEWIKTSQHSLWQQMQALIAKEVGSQVRASFGSHLMLDRKREIPPLRHERELLEMAIQPSLLN
jgi:Rha family phage regulatory protein